MADAGVFSKSSVIDNKINTPSNAFTNSAFDAQVVQKKAP